MRALAGRFPIVAGVFGRDLDGLLATECGPFRRMLELQLRRHAACGWIRERVFIDGSSPVIRLTVLVEQLPLAVGLLLVAVHVGPRLAAVTGRLRLSRSSPLEEPPLRLLCARRVRRAVVGSSGRPLVIGKRRLAVFWARFVVGSV